jgi:hypothetical protein
VPEHTTYDSDLASGIAKLTEAAKAFVKEPGIRDKVIKAIEATKKLSGGVIEPNQLSKGKKKNGNVDVENILREKRVPEICRFVVGDGVSVGSELFDGAKPGSFSKLHPERQYGVVTNLWREKKIVEVEYLDGSRFRHAFRQVRIEKPKTKALLILQVQKAEGFKKEDDPLDKDNWPKNFFEAIIRPDWRSWVEAVKKEIASWLTFNRKWIGPSTYPI